MSGKKKHDRNKPARDYPALREFFSGYLHQDFRDEYGTAAGAVRAFCQDASLAEVSAVRQAWKTWRAALATSSPREIARAARQLGAAWQPETREDLDQVETALNGE